MLPRERFPRFCVQQTLLAADASKTLVAATAGKTIVVTRVVLTGIIAAAQAVYVGDTSGTVKFLDVPASAPAVGLQILGMVEEGLRLTVAEAFIIKPVAAGPQIHCLAEGYIIGPFV